MPKHLTVDGCHAVCGPAVGELAEDTYTTDPDLTDCFECEGLLGRPQAAAAAAKSYAQGYADGKEKTYFEMENWRPADHHRGCGCQPCSVARGILHKVLGQEAWR